MYGSIVEKICSTKELQLGNYHREITAADNLYRNYCKKILIFFIAHYLRLKSMHRQRIMIG
jgi:hypothetical protein